MLGIKSSPPPDARSQSAAPSGSTPPLCPGPVPNRIEPLLTKGGNFAKTRAESAGPPRCGRGEGDTGPGEGAAAGGSAGKGRSGQRGESGACVREGRPDGTNRRIIGRRVTACQRAGLGGTQPSAGRHGAPLLAGLRYTALPRPPHGSRPRGAPAAPAGDTKPVTTRKAPPKAARYPEPRRQAHLSRGR